MSKIYNVGDVVFVVPNDSRWAAPYDAKIAAVGRRWATLEGYRGRFDISTGMLDGGSGRSVGTVYTSRAEWEQKQAADRAWLKVREDVRYRMEAPAGVTPDAIAQARALLGLEKVGA